MRDAEPCLLRQIVEAYKVATFCASSTRHEALFAMGIKPHKCMHCSLEIAPIACTMCKGSGRLKIRCANPAIPPWRVIICEQCRGSGAGEWIAVEQQEVKP